MVESKDQIAKEEQKQGGARFEHLRAMEKVQARANYEDKIFAANATAGYENLSFEEKNAGKYYCTFPYPYMNGYMHLGKCQINEQIIKDLTSFSRVFLILIINSLFFIGHAYSISKCEYQVRYQRQKGKNVLFPFSFHCTGMPIQASSVRLTREIKNGTTKDQKDKEGKVVLTQYEILMQLGIEEAEIPKF